MQRPQEYMDRPATPDLSRFDEEYRRVPASNANAGASAAAAASSSGTTRFVLPDGSYRVMVESVELTTAKVSGHPMLKWRLRVTAGSHENRLLFKNRVITSNTIEWVRKELEVCGISPEPFSSLPSRLRELANIELAVAKVTKGEHDNIYVNKRLTPPREDEIAELADDLPF